MTRACVTAWAVVALLPGCGRAPRPADPPNPTPAKDRAELEERFEWLRRNAPVPEVTALMGKRGAALAGYSTTLVRSRPDGADGAVGTRETDQYWTAGDGTAAVRVVFAADGRARLVQLLTITPTGPPPPPLPLDPPTP